MQDLYLIYDANQTPEANISSFGTQLASWLNSLATSWGGKYIDVAAKLDNLATIASKLDMVDTQLSTLDTTIDSAANRIAVALEKLSPQDLHDQAVDAMRRELAHLLAENARLKRQAEEEGTSNVPESDRGEAEGTPGAGAQDEECSGVDPRSAGSSEGDDAPERGQDHRLEDPGPAA